MPLLFHRIRDVLIGLLVAMGVVSLLASVALVRSVRDDLHSSEWISRINHLNDALFREAMATAMERGLVTLALTLPELPPDLGQALAAARQEALARRAITAAQTAAVLKEAPLSSFAPLAATVRERYAALEKLRRAVAARLDNGTTGVTPEAWFETVSLYNDSLGTMQGAACNTPPAPFAASDACLAFKQDIFWVGEYATRERGLVSRAIASRRPFTSDELTQLHGYHVVIEYSLERIGESVQNRFPQRPEIATLATQVRNEYSGRYGEALRSVVAAGSVGAVYPIDAVTWYRQASAAVEPLLGLMKMLGAAIDTSVEEFRAESLRAAAGLAALLLVVLATLAGTVVTVQRRILSRLGQLQATARGIASGDLDRPVTVRGGDELGELGDAFERMRRALGADRATREATETRLRTANEELARFAYVVSNDLKAPLRAIHNLAGWIDQDLCDRLSKESREHLALLQDRVRRMDDLINALLEYSRVGSRVGGIEEVATKGLVDEVIQLRGVPDGFTVVVHEPMPTLVTDRVQLQQVFANLIGNAIEHHDRRDGRVEISAQEAGACWRFAVADDGPGIPADQHARIFEIFQRLDTRSRDGTGIGLAIVKKAVERLGGAVAVESAPGQGSVFRFTWPKRLSARDGELVEPGHPPPGRMSA